MSCDLASVDLNLLFTFHTFVESGGVARAARRLGRSQPAVSARLHQLERDLGVTLFERVGRRLQLTPIGRAVEEETRALIGNARKLVELARSSDREPVGTLRIGSLPTVGVYLLAPSIARFVADNPRVEARLQLGPTDTALAELLEGRLDVVVSVGQPPAGRLEVERIATVRPVLVLPKTMRPMPRGNVSVRELARLPLVGYGRVGDSFFDSVWDFLERHEMDRRIRIVVPHIAMIKTLILNGAGATILPDYTIVEPELTTRAVAGLDLVQPVWIARRFARRTLPLIEGFRRELTRVSRVQ